MKILKILSLICLLLTTFFNLSFIPFEQHARLPLLPSMEPFQVHIKSQPLFEIDSQSVQIAEEIGGGIYYREVDAIVPFFPSLVRAEWLNYKNYIAERIGPIYPTTTKESLSWKNSATSIDLLVKDAQTAAPHFLEMCMFVAHKTGSTANFGIDNQYMIKSKRSIARKIQESTRGGLSESDAVSKVRDALRGTIIAETPEQISLITESLKEYAHNLGREIIFINIWEENRPSGYVGIHAKMLFPVYDNKGLYTQRDVIVEIQIHLKCIMDGTKRCVKEREHLMYDQMRKKGVDPEIQTAASNLLYLTALKQSIPKKFIKKTIRH